MNQQRKAGLQRKLSMTSVPKPPAGLSERLKADIPENLARVTSDRSRFRRPGTFGLSVAASVVLLIASAYIALQVLPRGETKIVSSPPSMVSRRQAPAAPQAEVTVTLAENKKDVNTGRVAEVSTVVRRDEPERQFADARTKLTKTRPTIVAEESPKDEIEPAAPAASGIAQAPAAAAPAAAGQVAERTAAKKETMRMNTAGASVFSVVPQREVFGLSVDPSAFDRVRQEIEQGQRPPARSIDIAALVNYFSGRGNAVRSDVELDVEASRAPLAPENTALLRFTIDTPQGQPAAFATGAGLAITLNNTAVLTHRLIGAEALKTQSELLTNVSVTGLMDLKLKPAINPRTTIATLTLRYRTVSDGRTHAITRVVHASDIEHDWGSATRRHRLATLGAVWSESLHGGAAADDVARTAEKLATEEPGDEKAKELAAAATASSRLQSFGPTGSGR